MKVMERKDAALLLLAMCIFGANFVASKYTLNHFPPFFSTALRLILIALLLLPFVPRPKISMRWMLGYAFVNAFHFSMGIGGMYYGLAVATNVIVSQLAVPLSCLFGAFFLKEYFGPWRAFGMAIAFGGILMVAEAPSVEGAYGAFIMAVAGAVMGAVSSVMMKHMRMEFFTQMAWMSLYATPVLLVLSYLYEDHQIELLMTTTWSAGLSLGYTVLLSNLVAFRIWANSLQKYTVNQVAPFGLLVPFFGIVFGQVVFHEHFTWRLIAGGLITMAGVAIIILRRPKRETISEVSA